MEERKEKYYRPLDVTRIYLASLSSLLERKSFLQPPEVVQSAAGIQPHSLIMWVSVSVTQLSLSHP